MKKTENAKNMIEQFFVITRFVFSSTYRNIGILYFFFAFFSGFIEAFFIIFFFIDLNIFSFSSENYFSEKVINKIQIILNTGEGIFHKTFLLGDIHTLVMIFFMTIPTLFCGFGSLLIPPMIGAKDMAFPSLNRLGFWVYVFAFFLFIAILVGFYEENTFFLLSLTLHSIMISSVLCAINFIVTILIMKNPNKSFTTFSPFVWSILITSFLVLLCMPIMAVSGTMALLSGLGLHFFEKNELLENARFITYFLIYPETYILLLLSFGLLWHILIISSKRLLLAEKPGIFFQIVIEAGGFILWTGILFQKNLSSLYYCYFYSSFIIICFLASFIIFTLLISLIFFFSKKKSPYLLWILGFIYVLIVSVILTIFSILDLKLLITKNISYFHSSMTLSSIFAIFAGCHFWFPVFSGFKIRSETVVIHFLVIFIAVNFTLMVYLSDIFLYNYNEWSQNFIHILLENRNKFFVFIFLAPVVSQSIFIYAMLEALVLARPVTTRKSFFLLDSQDFF